MIFTHVPEDFCEECEVCGEYITKYDSCECGITAIDFIEIQGNEAELNEKGW